MRFLQQLLFQSLILTVFSQDFDSTAYLKDSKFTEIFNIKEINEAMTKNNSLIVFAVYRFPSDGGCIYNSCKQTEMVLQDLAQDNENLATYLRLDCELLAAVEYVNFPECHHENFASKENQVNIYILQAPIIKTQNKGRQVNVHHYNLYEGSEDKILDKMLELLPNFRHQISDKRGFAKFERGLGDRAKVLLISGPDRTDSEIWFKQITHAYKDQILFGELRAKGEGQVILDSLEIDTKDLGSGSQLYFMGNYPNRENYGRFAKLADVFSGFYELENFLKEFVLEYNSEFAYDQDFVYSNAKEIIDTKLAMIKRNIPDMSDIEKLDQTATQFETNQIQLIHVYDREEPDQFWLELIAHAPAPIAPVMIQKKTWLSWCGLAGSDFCTSALKLLGPGTNCKLIVQPMGEATYKFKNGKCLALVDSQPKPQQIFDKIHKHIMDLTPLTEYKEESLADKILWSLGSEQKMMGICITDSLNGIPWEFFAINSDPYYRKWLNFAYVKNISEKAAKIMSVNSKDLPTFGVAHSKQADLHSRTFYSFSQHASKGETYHYESFKGIFDAEIEKRKLLLGEYEKSFPVCDREWIKSTTHENWHFLFGSNLDDYEENSAYLKGINFRFELGGCQVNIACNNSLRRILKLDSELGYMVHFIPGEKFIQMIEIDIIKNDDYIQKNYLEILKKRRSNMSIPVVYYKELLEKDDCHNYEGQMPEMDL